MAMQSKIVNNLVDEKPKILLDFFLERFGKIREIDNDVIKNSIEETKKFYQGEFDENCLAAKLENSWYSSLKNGFPDYSVYDDSQYFVELLFCWLEYSRKYIKNLKMCFLRNTKKSIFEILEGQKKIVDLGCGLGITTATLSQLFSKNEVFGTNLEDTEQYKCCMQLASEFGFRLSPDISVLKNVDVIFAFEYFEHFETPIRHLFEVIYSSKPNFLVLANSFNTKAVGHFWRYKVQNGSKWEVISSEKISRLFNDTLRKLGYQMLKTTFWNNKPSVWVKKSYKPS